MATLLNNDVKVRFNDQPIRINDQYFDRGTLIVAKRDNKALGDRFESVVTRLANESQRRGEIVKTGFMDGGPDIGSRNVNLIEKPRVAMIKGDGVSSYG